MSERTDSLKAAASETACICTPDQRQGSGHGVNCPARPASETVEAAWERARGYPTFDGDAFVGWTSDPTGHFILSSSRHIIEAAIRAEYEGQLDSWLRKVGRAEADERPCPWCGGRRSEFPALRRDEG